MLPEELLRKVKLIEFRSKKMVNDVLTGQYRSHFKGHGVQFSEHRLYVPGDDIRHIDWKVSARTRDLLIKKFEEERELNVFLVVDLSASENFGSSSRLKAEAVAEVGGMLAYAASHTGDKVGLLIFAGEVEHLLPPKRGKQHVLRVIRDLLSHQGKTRGTNLEVALKAADRVMKHSGIIFVMSDFLTSGYEIILSKLATKHDVVVLNFEDEREKVLPPLGSMLFQDPETLQERWVDTSSYAFKKWFEEFQFQHRKQLKSIFSKNRVDQLSINTKEDYGDAVVKFFQARMQRGKRS